MRLLGYILDQLVKNMREKDPHAQFFDIQAQVRDLKEALKRMWTENGDKLSMQYTGTSSNVSGVLEEGKQGFAGKFNQMMTGVKRFVVSNTTDDFKQ